MQERNIQVLHTWTWKVFRLSQSSGKTSEEKVAKRSISVKNTVCKSETRAKSRLQPTERLRTAAHISSCSVHAAVAAKASNRLSILSGASCANSSSTGTLKSATFACAQTCCIVANRHDAIAVHSQRLRCIHLRATLHTYIAWVAVLLRYCTGTPSDNSHKWNPQPGCLGWREGKR